MTKAEQLRVVAWRLRILQQAAAKPRRGRGLSQLADD